MPSSYVASTCRHPLSCSRELSLVTGTIIMTLNSHAIILCRVQMPSSFVVFTFHYPFSCSRSAVPCHWHHHYDTELTCHHPLSRSHAIILCRVHMPSSFVVFTCHHPLSCSHAIILRLVHESRPSSPARPTSTTNTPTTIIHCDND